MSNEGDGMAKVTEADREKAAELLPDSVPAYYRGPATTAIAVALAEEREKAREQGYDDGYTDGHSDGVAEGMGDV